MQRYLIVTADDFGLHDSINVAVERANRVGILTAASLMVSAPATRDAVERARRLPNLSVGLHVTVSDGWSTLPHGDIPLIAGANGFMDGGMWQRAVKVFASRTARNQLEAEVRAQFAAFARTGLVLDHVNVHKHLHLHPTILSILLRVGGEFGVCAVRIPAEPLWFAHHAGQLRGATETLLLRPWVAQMKHRVRSAGLFHNDRIFGIAASGKMDEEHLLAILERLPEGVSEIYSHPAALATALITPAMRTYRHAEELSALTSPRVVAAVAALNLVRGGYSSVMRSVGRSPA